MALKLLDLPLQGVFQLLLLRRIGRLLDLIVDSLEGLNALRDFLEAFIDLLLDLPSCHGCYDLVLSILSYTVRRYRLVGLDEAVGSLPLGVNRRDENCSRSGSLPQEVYQALLGFGEPLCRESTPSFV